MVCDLSSLYDSLDFMFFCNWLHAHGILIFCDFLQSFNVDSFKLQDNNNHVHISKDLFKLILVSSLLVENYKQDVCTYCAKKA